MGADHIGAENYRRVLRALKHRHALVSKLLIGQVHLETAEATVEATYLQIRVMLELIAFASLGANIRLFAQAQEKYSKYWHAKYMLRDLEQINPDFYPRPRILDESAELRARGLRGRLVDADPSTYLTRKNFERLWEKCGRILHARNPFTEGLDHQALFVEAHDAHRSIIQLLNHHEIRLVGDVHTYYFELGDETQDVSYAVLYPKEALKVFSPAPT